MKTGDTVSGPEKNADSSADAGRDADEGPRQRVRQRTLVGEQKAHQPHQYERRCERHREAWPRGAISDRHAGDATSPA